MNLNTERSRLSLFVNSDVAKPPFRFHRSLCVMMVCMPTHQPSVRCVLFYF
eukprot:m.12618 g.12618  ORF g.12618 m.12618 type:complete len:51 (-) comp5837_c0_seq1:692-844(-)